MSSTKREKKCRVCWDDRIAVLKCYVGNNSVTKHVKKAKRYLEIINDERIKVIRAPVFVNENYVILRFLI